MRDLRKFETRNDASGSWLHCASPNTTRKTITVFVVSEKPAQTVSTTLSAKDTLRLAHWLIDAYEAMGYEFPGLERR